MQLLGLNIHLGLQRRQLLGVMTAEVLELCFKPLLLVQQLLHLSFQSNHTIWQIILHWCINLGHDCILDT